MTRLALNNLAHLAFAAVAITIVVLGWVHYDAAIESREATRWVNHSQEVLGAIGRVNENLGRAESAQRGYLFSGSDAFLSERDQLLGIVGTAIADIVKLSADNPVQLSRAHRLEELFADRIAIMKTIAAQRRDEGMDAAGRSSIGAGQQASARIYELTDAMRQEERRLLQLRGAEEDRRNEGILFFLAIAGAIISIILLPGYLGLVFQIRARARAQQVVVAKSRRLALIAERTNNAVILTDVEGRIEWVNAGFERVTEYTIDEVRGKKPGSFLQGPETDQGTVALIRERLRQRQRFDVKIVNYGKHGRKYWLQIACEPLYNEAGKLTQFMAIETDISESKTAEFELLRARDAAETATRTKSVFLATMSHEIRTPMNGLFGMLELLSLTKLDPEQRKTLSVVRESGKSLRRIIDDILDFSKMEAGKLEVRPEPASVHAAMEAVRTIYLGAASAKGTLLRCGVDPGISSALLFDPMRVRQILNNFVSNALKFTVKGHVEINAELVGRAAGKERVRFSVVDTGIGIAPEDQARLFQPFVQAAGDTAAKFGGTGLGLAICQRLATMMGGTIEMVSTPGVGTTMILELSLPVANPEDLPNTDPVGGRDWLETLPAMRRMAPDRARAQAEGTLVLLADDHPVNLLLIEGQVKTLGYAAECAKDGEEALEKWKSGRFGIVITDCNMPKIDGYELARSIRRLESANGGTRVPIIACTANALDGQAEICIAAGMDDYLVKPVELKALLKKLDQWLPIPRPGESVSQVPPIDPAVIARLTGGDAAVERKVLEIFQRTNAEDVVILRQAVVERDIEQIMRTAHRIKGASRTMGATALAAVCERLERAGGAGDWSAVEVDMGAFHHEMERLNTYEDAK